MRRAPLPQLSRNIKLLISVIQRQPVQIIIHHPRRTCVSGSQTQLPGKRRLLRAVGRLRRLCVLGLAGEGEGTEFVECVAVLGEYRDLGAVGVSV